MTKEQIEKLARFAGFRFIDNPCTCGDKNCLNPRERYWVSPTGEVYFELDSHLWICWEDCEKWLVPKLPYFSIEHDSTGYHVEIQGMWFEEASTLVAAFTGEVLKYLGGDQMSALCPRTPSRRAHMDRCRWLSVTIDRRRRGGGYAAKEWTECECPDEGTTGDCDNCSMFEVLPGDEEGI